MIECPFCGFSNEDGALFCEQCKSDLAGVPSTGAGPAVMADVIEASPVEEAQVADVIEASPVEATPWAAEPVPAADVIEASPVMAEAIEASPVEVEATPVEAEVSPVEVEASPVVAEPAAPVDEPVPPPPPYTPAAEPVPAQPAAQTPASPPPQPAPAPQPAAAAPAAQIPEGAEPKLVVIRGQKVNHIFPIYEGPNYIGRADEQPVDIDLEDQEPPDRIWCSRQHALILFESGSLTLEDLNSSNGTYLNRQRVYPGQPQPLKTNDVIQIGTVQLKVKI
jgi:pSer/pThr/pTyr-binding forkhead associated (FHA) protein